MTLDAPPLRPALARRRPRAGVAMLSEDRSRDGLVLPASILDNLTLASLRRAEPQGVLDRGGQGEAASDQEVRGWDAAASLGRPVRRLTGGNQQKARWAGGGWMGRACSSSTSPPAASTWGPRRRSTGLWPGWPSGGWPCCWSPRSCRRGSIGMSDRIIVMRHGRVAGEVAAAEATEERLLAIASGIVGMAA